MRHLVIILAALCISHSASASRGADQDKPRHLEDYFRAPDPKEAAERLLSDAASEGYDLDHRADFLEPRPIGFPSGHFMPAADGWLDDLLSSVAPETDFSAVIQLNRGISFREIAGIMSLGVRIEREMVGSYIATINSSIIKQLASLDYVRWIGRFDAHYKFTGDPSAIDHETGVGVWALHAIDDDMRADVIALGLEITAEIPRWNCLAVAVRNEDDVQALARLPWVWKVELPTTFHTLTAPDGP